MLEVLLPTDKPPLNVIWEDSRLIAVNKPAGLVCHPTKNGEYSSLIGRARLHLGPGAHPQLLNRLDRETSGVVLFGLEQQMARQVRRLLEHREVDKEYLAIVHGHVAEGVGRIDAPLGSDDQSRVAIKDCVRPDGAQALTEFQVERRFEFPSPTEPNAAGQERSMRPATLLRVWPRTGRKHRIRIHLAHLGHPIIGDKLYGGDEDLYLGLVEDRLKPADWARLVLPFHALHAVSVNFRMQETEYAFHADPEPWFNAMLQPPGNHSVVK